MKTYIISLSLIAGSAGAGFGLSALHGINMKDQPQIITAASVQPTASGFLIPEFVPAQPVAPVVSALKPTPLSQAQTPSAVMDASLWVDPGVSRRPNQRDGAALSAWQDSQPRAVVPPVAASRTSGSRASAGQSLVPTFSASSTQAVSLRVAPVRAAAPAVEPDYLVGVYR